MAQSLCRQSATCLVIWFVSHWSSPWKEDCTGTQGICFRSQPCSWLAGYLTSFTLDFIIVKIRDLHALLVKIKMVQMMWKTGWQFLKGSNTGLAYYPTTLLLGICSKEWKMDSDILKPIFRAFFTALKSGNKCLSAKEQINRWRYPQVKCPTLNSRHQQAMLRRQLCAPQFNLPLTPPPSGGHQMAQVKGSVPPPPTHFRGRLPVTPVLLTGCKSEVPKACPWVWLTS